MKILSGVNLLFVVIVIGLISLGVLFQLDLNKFNEFCEELNLEPNYNYVECYEIKGKQIVHTWKVKRINADFYLEIPQ